MASSTPLRASVAAGRGAASAPLAARLARRINATNVVPLALGILIVSGIGDVATDVQLTFTLLYVFPVALGTWFRGRGFGALLAALATVFASATMVLSGGARIHPLIVTWNSVGTLGVLLVLTAVLDRLRRYVEREHRERTRAVEQLRHADRLSVIGTLAAGVAHEIGTPLGVIAGTAELLEGSDVDGESARASLRTIREQSDRIAKIMRGLLDFGRRGGSARSLVSLEKIAASAVDLLGASLEKRRCSVAYEPSGARLDVLVNAAEIEQVIFNLLANGAQAMPGGGTLRVSCQRRRGALGASRNATLCCVVVEDEGIGISDEQLPHIFDPFFTTKEVGQGTGLGLSISYGIVSDHGGRIDVESAPGRGARFEVVLPAASRGDSLS